MKRFTTLFILLACWTLARGQIQIVASDSSGCAPIQVNFSLTGNVPPNVISYTWSANGTPFGSQSNPSRIFTTAGSYSISVLIIPQSGAPQTIRMAVPVEVFDGPTADFSARPVLLCKDEPITFTDLSTPGSAPVTAWVWAFGDGTISNGQNPVKRYNQAGFYSVSLQAIDANGCDATEYKNQYVDVRWPDAAFSGGPTSACNSPHFPILTAINRGAGLSHQWDFGNGRGGTGPSVQPIYNNNGSFSITHILTDPSGCADTVTAPHFINVGNNQANIIASKSVLCNGDTVFLSCNSTTSYGITWNLAGKRATSCDTFFTTLNAGVYPITLEMTEPGGCIVRDSISVQFFRPNADFEGDTLFACDPPFRVRFTNLSTGTQNMTYDWDFGDGKTSTLGSPSNVYASKGIFSVTLFATDSLGCRARARKNSYVRVGGASASFSQNPRTGGCKPLDVTFAPVAPAGTAHLWVFGDGDSSRATTPQHTYLDTGFYQVRHYIIDPQGCVDSALGVVTVGDSVSAQFQISDTTPCSGQQISFTNTSTGNYNYQIWDFGGWGASIDQHPVFAFRDTGYQYVQLIASDRGCSDTLRIDSAVYVLPPRAFAAGNFVGCDTPHTVFFRDSSIGAHRYWWDFGTGNPADTSNQRDPVFTYTQTGFYPVVHVVWNDSTGCSDTIRYTVVVEVFRMRIAASPTSGCNPLAVQFQDNSTGSAIWRWDFGDGGRGRTANPIHTYTQPGQYTATAIFFSAGACADQQRLTINVYQPVVRFQVPDTNVCAFEAVQFTDLSFSRIPKTAWLWDFGDGNQSTAANPTHRYTRPGHFTVTLTVTDSRGCVGTATYSRYIYVTSPIAAFSPAHAATCIGNPMAFVQFSTGQSRLTYDWDFGDGTLSSGSLNQIHAYAQNGIYNVRLIVTDSLDCKDSLTATRRSRGSGHWPFCNPNLQQLSSFAYQLHSRY
jgi:PKD repeat protein